MSAKDDVWEHFERCDDEIGKKKAKCRHCSNFYSYSTTVHNLKQHLSIQHDIYVQRINRTSTTTNFRSRKGNNKVWHYFTKSHHEDKRAICNLCEKLFSYKSTVGNLKLHLRKIHPESFERLCESDSLKTGEEVEYIEIEEEDNSEEEEGSPKAGGDVWSYFERDGGRVRCAVCRASVSRSSSALRDHLSRHHPKLLPENEDSDEGDNDTYTEVVYLEDSFLKEDKREERRRPPKRRKSEYQETKFRRLSPPRKKNQEDDELDSFGAYITCLLKSLPKNVCTAVQRDIINIIMAAKLSKPDDTQSLVIDGTPVIIKTLAHNKNFVVLDEKVSTDKPDAGEGASSFKDDERVEADNA